MGFIDISVNFYVKIKSITNSIILKKHEFLYHLQTWNGWSKAGFEHDQHIFSQYSTIHNL